MEQKVKIKQINKMIAAVKKTGMTDNTELTFSFVVSSLFPKAYENITKEMTRQYMEGFRAGKEAQKEE